MKNKQPPEFQIQRAPDSSPNNFYLWADSGQRCVWDVRHKSPSDNKIHTVNDRMTDHNDMY